MTDPGSLERADVLGAMSRKYGRSLAVLIRFRRDVSVPSVPGYFCCCRRARAARRPRPRNRAVAFRSRDRLPVLAGARKAVRLRPAERRRRASTTCRSSASSKTNGCAAGRCGRWVPKAFAGKPIYVFETGGTTGMPKSRIDHDDFRIDYSNLQRHAARRVLPAGSNWLMLGPSGPRRLRLAVEHLAQHRGGICFWSTSIRAGSSS